MADNNSSGIVAIFAILMIVLIGGFIAWRTGVFGGNDKAEIDVNVNTPGETAK